MGIENRGYYRQYGSGQPLPPVCKNLIIATVAVFLLQIFITRPSTPDDFRALVHENKRAADEERKPQVNREAAPESGKENSLEPDPKTRRTTEKTPDEEKTAPQDEVDEEEDFPGAANLPSVSIVQEWLELETHKVVWQGQVWRLLTCAFCHDRFSVWHIVVNMLFLYWFGRMLEPLYGAREFLLFYLTAAVVASLCHVVLDLYTHHSVPVIGASGAVMAVVVLYAIHHPREKIYVFMMIPMEIRWLVVIYVIFDLHPVLLALSGTPTYTGVANAAHLGGAAFGFLYWRYGLRLEDLWNRVTHLRYRVRLNRSVRLYQPRSKSKRNDLDALVDEILQKVHEQGESSLTDVERKVLRTAANRYKGRSDA